MGGVSLGVFSHSPTCGWSVTQSSLSSSKADLNPGASGSLDLETRVAVLRALQDNPKLSQRQLAELIGVSLGKTNYCLRALIEKGYVKAENFSANPRKLGYVYQLTPQGLAAKARITARFLKRKVEEHEALKREIASLQAEVAQMDGQFDGVLESEGLVGSDER